MLNRVRLLGRLPFVLPLLGVGIAACSSEPSSSGSGQDAATATGIASDGGSHGAEASAPQTDAAGGSRDGASGDAARDASVPVDAALGGCPKSACSEYVTRMATCDPGYDATDYCATYAQKCATLLPSCFCATDCQTLIDCYDYCP